MEKIQSFIEYIQYQKRYSPHTIKSYSNDLLQFSEFINDFFELQDVTEVTPSVVRSWVVDLVEQDVANTSVNRKLSGLKSFYKYALKKKWVKSSPAEQIQSLKKAKRLPLFVEENKMQELIFSDDLFDLETFEGVRDQLIIELFYNTGIRLSELINLLEKDVQQDSIKVLGKRNKERKIPISRGLSDQISHYQRVKKEQFSGKLTPQLMVSDKGGKLYEKFVYRKVNYYLSKVTTIKKKSPHILRHTFATHMLNNGADLGAIKEILGHASLAATQVYTHNSIDKLKNIYKQAHPRGE